MRSLADLTAEWRDRASNALGEDATPLGTHQRQWRHTHGPSPDDFGDSLIHEVATQVVDEVGEKRTTWRHWNLWAEASRQTMGWRFATVEYREVVVARVVDAAERGSVALTPPEPTRTPAEFQREDGTSVFRLRHATVYSSTAMLEAEDRLLGRASDTTAGVVHRSVVTTATKHGRRAGELSDEQAQAIVQITGSGRRLDLLAGSAGAGKTTTMRGLRVALARAYGRQSVVGLAPSAAAAEVLADDLGIPCENTAKWLYEHDQGEPKYTPSCNQLLIVDEASMAATRTLDRITEIAATAGAKVLLVGDPAQIDAVDAGGAFALLVSARTDVPTLTDIHRFTHEWEKDASLKLRDGMLAAISAYARHDRVHDGTTDEVLARARDAWEQDVRAGKAALLIAETGEQVHALNRQIRAARIHAGQTSTGREALLADEHRVSAGDWVITRSNDRTLRTLTGIWVRNGHRWKVLDVHKGGSMTVRRQHGRRVTLTLPADYVQTYVDLGYAVTAHRAEGLTVDTAHVIVTPRTTREHLYVAMTRGRDANTAYVALDQPDETHTGPETDDVTGETVLHRVLQHIGAEPSAHQTIKTEQETWTSIAQLAAEYETLAAHAQRDRWTTLLSTSGLTPDQADDVIESDAFGPLTAVLRRIEADGQDPERILKRAVSRGGLADAEDVAAVLHHRLRLASNRRPMSRGAYVAGLLPKAAGRLPDGYDTALAERAALIDSIAQRLADEAIRTHALWLRQLGSPPTAPEPRVRWLESVTTIAAYRDRYQVDSDLPLGPRPESAAQRTDADRAALALRAGKDAAATTSAVGAGVAAPTMSGP